MLQVIHQKNAAPRASSIYCRWIREEGRDGGHLVAVWMDFEMRCFERDFATNPAEQLLQEDALEEPGGWVLVRSSRVAST